MEQIGPINWSLKHSKLPLPKQNKKLKHLLFPQTPSKATACPHHFVSKQLVWKCCFTDGFYVVCASESPWFEPAISYPFLTGFYIYKLYMLIWVS